MFSQCPLDLGEKIVDQSLRVGKAIGTAWIVYRPVPMIISSFGVHSYRRS